jgi:hypothetical protein
MPALTLDEQLIFDVAVALKKVKIPGFRKGMVEETNVRALCEELGITRSTLYRHVSPSGELRAHGRASPA